MTYQEEKKDQRNKEKELAEKARVEQAFADFFDQNREVINCIANISVLTSFFEGDTSQITAQKLQDALDYTSVNQHLAKQSEYVERQKLVNYIIANRTMSPETEKHERARLLSDLTHISTVRTIADNIRRKRELAALSTDQLKAVARGPAKDGYMEVPIMYRSKIMLLDLASTDLPAFKRLLARTRPGAIDAILAQRDDEE